MILSIFSFSGDAICAKFGTNCQITLRRPRKDLSSVKLVGGLSPQIVCIVCDASSQRLGKVTWPRRPIISVKKHFCSLVEALALCKS